MRVLYHLWLSPFSRKVRVVLGEKALDCELRVERTWARRPEFFALNPAGTVPVLVDEDGAVIADSGAICEYLDEVYPRGRLIGIDAGARAETRRLVNWFDVKFHREVSADILEERVMKRFMGRGEPSAERIRAGLHNIGYHLDYISYLIERRRWLAGDAFSLADIAAAAHLSCLDYLGDVPWNRQPLAKDWYARVKSRPSFRPLLADRISGMTPPRHYDDLDF